MRLKQRLLDGGAALGTRVWFGTSMNALMRRCAADIGEEHGRRTLFAGLREKKEKIRVLTVISSSQRGKRKQLSRLTVI